AVIEPCEETVSVDGERVQNWEQAQNQILLRPERTIELKVRRDGTERRISVVSEASGRDRMGTIGVYPLVRVGEVVAGQPAAQAGLRVDDAILRIDAQPIKSFEDIRTVVTGSSGDPLDFELYRDGKIIH